MKIEHRRHYPRRRRYPELIGWGSRLASLAKDDAKGLLAFGLFVAILVWFFIEVSSNPREDVGNFLDCVLRHGLLVRE